MANAKVCDLCRKFYIPNGHVTRYGLFKNHNVFTEEAVDMCHECEYKLEDFVKSIKEKDDAEN